MRIVALAGLIVGAVAGVALLGGHSGSPTARAQDGDGELRPAVAELQGRVAALEGRVADLEARADWGGQDGEAVPGVAEAGTAVAASGLELRLLAGGERAGPQDLTVLVSDAAGAPVGGAAVTVAVRMPAMDHGVSAYPAPEAAPGRYVAEGASMGMGGEWLVEVRAVRAGRAPAVALFRVGLAE